MENGYGINFQAPYKNGTVYSKVGSKAIIKTNLIAKFDVWFYEF